MKKIFYLLFPLIFFLVSFSFFSPKIFAASCSSLGGNCGSPTSSSCEAGTIAISGATDCLGGVCCGTASSNSSSNAVPIGQYGCSFDTSTNAPIIACATGGKCISEPPYSTFNSTTNATNNGYCEDIQNKCYICDTNAGYQYDYYTGKCDSPTSGQASQDPTSTTCTAGQSCSYGYGCGAGAPPAPQPLSICQNGVCKTALGNLPTTISGLLTTVFSIALSIAGVVALGLIIASGYRLMISQGNPEQVKGAREQLTAAIIGLLFIIFSLVILQIIGVNILKIPGFG